VPLVSVIVPVYNDRDGIQRCLAALATQTWPADRLDVIVVDNGSSPALAIDGSAARVIVEPRPGSYAARNAGVAAAAGEILAFTDADCVPDPGWIERGVTRLLTARQCGLVAGAIRVSMRDPAAPTASELVEVLTAFPQRRFVERDRFGATANVFVSRAVFDRVGGFDPAMMSAGDVDFGERVHAAGFDVVYASDACVEHPARASMRQLCRKVVRSESGLRDLETRRARRVPGYRRKARPIVPELGLMLEVVRSSGARLAALGIQRRHRARATAALAFMLMFRAGVAVAINAGLRPDLRRIWG
jgi:GT2 family glycosyltransferase